MNKIIFIGLSLPLIFNIQSEAPIHFKITNTIFDVEGTSDENNNITYAELKKCNSNHDQCELTKIILKSIPSKAKPTSIESLRTNLQNIAEVATNGENNRTANVIMALSMLLGTLGIGQSNLDPNTHKSFGVLFVANAIHSGVSAVVDNKSIANKPLIATDVILGVANGVFIAKAIGAAASPWAVGGLLAYNIARNIFNIAYRAFPTKTTVTITKSSEATK